MNKKEFTQTSARLMISDMEIKKTNMFTSKATFSDVYSSQWQAIFIVFEVSSFAKPLSAIIDKRDSL